MLQTITELRDAGIHVIPLGYKDGKFIHPIYHDKFTAGMSENDLSELVKSGYDKGIAMMHGACNKELMCLDIDEKNAPGINLYEKLKHIIDDMILQKLVIERTRSQGYHIYFTCKTLPTDKALASSATGAEWIAVRSAVSNCITYCAPSPGYTEMQGGLLDIQELTGDEMRQLCDAAAQLNEFEGATEKKNNALVSVRPPAEFAPAFRAFDQNIDSDWMMDILAEKGWTTDGAIRRKTVNAEKWEYMKYWRPGRAQSEPYSGNLWINKKRFSVFTSSTELPAFDSGENFSHRPSDLLYYFNGRDWRAAYGKIVQVAEAGKVELPKHIPMCFAVIVNNRESWRVDVKGIMDWARRAGYCWLRMSSTEESSKTLCRVVNNIIYEADMTDLQREYLREVDKVYVGEGENRLLYNFMPSVVKYMDSLPIFDQKILRDARGVSYIFFTNGALKITKDKADLIRYNEIDGCVFHKHIKNFDYKPADGHGNFGQFIDMISHNAEHKAFIMSAIGYIMHYYKLRDFAKALMIIEDVEDQEQARGRSGKGLIAQFVEYIRWTVQQDGRNYKGDSQFKMQRVVPGVQIFYLNDPDTGLLMNQFYNIITDDMLIEAKGKKSYTIPFDHSPKLLITTNYLPNLESDSDKDRFIVLAIKKVFGSSFTLREAFPGVVFFADDWEDYNRNGVIRLAIDCIQMYLNKGVVVYQSDEMKRNADMRVVKNIVSDSIIETMEKVMEVAESVKSDHEFQQGLGVIDLRRDQPESIKYAFAWEFGRLIIYVSRFYQYALRAYSLKSYTDKRFSKNLNLFIDKQGLPKLEEKRNNVSGRRVVIQLKSADVEKRTLDENLSYDEELPF